MELFECYERASTGRSAGDRDDLRHAWRSRANADHERAERFWGLESRWPLIQPVVHVTSEEQAVRQAALCTEHGADGVFLIGHGTTWPEMMPIVSRVQAEVGGFVGVNLLDRLAADVLAELSIAAVWADARGDADIRHHEDAPLFYSGFAFKYQPQPDDLAVAATDEALTCDVLTTSGGGTGYAPDVAKLRAIRAAVPGMPVAVASGVTPANAATILPWVDAVLVATGISSAFDEIDPDALSMLLAVRNDLWARTG